MKDAFCHNWSRQQLVDEIVREKPDVVGLNCSTHTFLDASAVLEQVSARLPDAVIVMGGYHATLATGQIPRECPFIDYVVSGEGEASFVTLLDRIEQGLKPEGVPRISYIDGGAMVSTGPELIEDLDALPFPDRSMLGDFEYGYLFQGIPLTFGRFTQYALPEAAPTTVLIAVAPPSRNAAGDTAVPVTWSTRWSKSTGRAMTAWS